MSSAASLRSSLGRRRPAAFDVFCYVFTYSWALILLYPVLFIVSLSLRRREELTDATFGLIPFHIQWANYIDAFSLMARYVVPIPILMMNSALATASAVFVSFIRSPMRRDYVMPSAPAGSGSPAEP